jgi:hypothetical protein
MDTEVALAPKYYQACLGEFYFKNLNTILASFQTGSAPRALAKKTEIRDPFLEFFKAPQRVFQKHYFHNFS